VGVPAISKAKVIVGIVEAFICGLLPSLDGLYFFGFFLAKPTPLMNVGSIFFKFFTLD
jgi:hypothetical protein